MSGWDPGRLPVYFPAAAHNFRMGIMLTIKNKEFTELIEFIRSNYGINLIHKRTLIEGRLSNIIIERGFDSFGSYLKKVFSDTTGAEITQLVNKLTTNHTFFMREANHFKYFNDVVLPGIAGSKTRDMRVWSAGCSSGEEPYTLAMIIHDYLGEERKNWDTRLLATDISVKALEKAERGVYRQEDMLEVPKKWKLNYFKTLKDEAFQICDEIRNDVIFRIFNLMEPQFPFKRKFHVIFCRNVMIYFDPKTKNELAEKFYDCLEPGGYLFIGHSESLNREATRFRYIMPAVYRKG